MSRQGDAGRRILGVDSDALIHWAMAGAKHHRAVRECFEREVREHGRCLGMTQQTLNEFLHVVTDPRRFEHPLPMAEAIRVSRELWHRHDVERIIATAEVHDRLCELMAEFRLGRKRILDTALAAILEAAGVRRLATLNGRDFTIFPFIEVVDPSQE